jgi:hypothetical protein
VRPHSALFCTVSSSAVAECVWLEIVDQGTGRKFYANRETNERTWSMPEAYRVAHGIAPDAVPKEPLWWELFDET